MGFPVLRIAPCLLLVIASSCTPLDEHGAPDSGPDANLPGSGSDANTPDADVGGSFDAARPDVDAAAADGNDAAASNAPDAGPPVGRFRVEGGCLSASSGFGGGSLQVTPCDSVADQRFSIGSSGTLVAAGSNICVDVKDGDYAAGVVVLSTCSASDSQQWTFDHAHVHPRAKSTKCLAVPDADAGGSVSLTDCSGAPEQLFLPIDFPVKLQSDLDPGSSTKPVECLWVIDQVSARPELYQCIGGPSGTFTLSQEGEIMIHGQCLEVMYGNIGAGMLVLEPCNGSATGQKWAYDGQVISLSGKCIDVFYGNPVDYQPVDYVTCNATPAQRWNVVIAQ